ncbi:hypothetical protein D3C84_938120 [compost metagenome]
MLSRAGRIIFLAGRDGIIRSRRHIRNAVEARAVGECGILDTARCQTHFRSINQCACDILHLSCNRLCTAVYITVIFESPNIRLAVIQNLACKINAAVIGNRHGRIT